MRGWLTNISSSTLSSKPRSKVDLAGMHLPAPLFPFFVVDLNQSSKAVIAGEQDPALLERLSDGGQAVCFAVIVPVRAVRRWDLSIMLGGKIATGKDMCGREGRRGLHSVKKQYLVLRRDQDHASSRGVSRCSIMEAELGQAGLC